jgi:hypothetical protein
MKYIKLFEDIKDSLYKKIEGVKLGDVIDSCIIDIKKEFWYY